MKIYLVRHGQTDHNAKNMFYGWTDCDINGIGIKQAEELEKFFGTVSYDKIYTSDLLRARHTAEIIRGEKAVPIIADASFREMYYGDWEDRELPYIKENYTEELERWMKEWQVFSIPNGEVFTDFCVRIETALKKLISENKGKTVLLVSHGGAMSAILCYLSGSSYDSFWRFPSYQGCYSEVRISGNRISIDRLNCPAGEVQKQL